MAHIIKTVDEKPKVYSTDSDYIILGNLVEWSIGIKTTRMFDRSFAVDDTWSI